MLLLSKDRSVVEADLFEAVCMMNVSAVDNEIAKGSSKGTSMVEVMA